MSNVGYDTFFQKNPGTYFLVRNIAARKKRIKIFSYPIKNGEVRDLLDIPFVSEADIRHSLLKGELLVKIQTKEIIVVGSNIDLLQFSSEQKLFLQNAGITNGLEVIVSNTTMIEDVELVGIKNGINTIFTTNDKFIFDTNHKILVYTNGVRQVYASNFLTAESGGVGTGYDTVIFIEPPRSNYRLFVDYFKAP